MMDESRIKEIIENHKHFINGDCDGWESLRADLSGVVIPSAISLRDVDLRYANLSCADLSNVDMYGANLCNASLSAANLRSVNLRSANLANANLHDTNLDGAILCDADLSNIDLRNAYLSSANLRNANLSYTNLANANLRNANLSGANLLDAILVNASLRSADLSCADLRGANLLYANLSDTDLDNAKGSLIEYRRGKILTEDIIGYKKCKHDTIITLIIPSGAIVFSINGTKCRTNKAKVVAIDNGDVAYSIYDNTLYHVDDEITIHNFNCEYNVECAEGIHFFMTRKEAVEYVF